MRVLVGIVAVSLLLGEAAVAQESEHTQQLLLSARLLRRLQRDRDRQTVRWSNFQRRVETVPDSTERGFELALYYAVTHDERRGGDAVAWAMANKCQHRQAALVMDWVSEKITPEQRKTIQQASCEGRAHGDVASDARDNLFAAVAADRDAHELIDKAWPVLRDGIQKAPLVEPRALYALCEFLMTARVSMRQDLRRSEPQFFAHLPKQFLLSLKPAAVEHPDWMAHVAALALVSLDPNLESSQFLQGWAMEDRQMVRDGPGVAYELMWADPYLPGIAYQNMDPWIYAPTGGLFARTSWEPDACWVAVSPGYHDQANCRAASSQFGTLTLLTMTGSCMNVPARKNSESTMLRNVGPNAVVTLERDKQRTSSRADAAGLWPVPNDGAGRVCVTSGERR